MTRPNYLTLTDEMVDMMLRNGYTSEDLLKGFYIVSSKSYAKLKKEKSND